MAVLSRDNLDIFCNRNTSTVHVMFGYAKDLVIRSREVGIAVPLPVITAWPVVNEVGMGVIIHMLNKSQPMADYVSGSDLLHYLR